MIVKAGPHLNTCFHSATRELRSLSLLASALMLRSAAVRLMSLFRPTYGEAVEGENPWLMLGRALPAEALAGLACGLHTHVQQHWDKCFEVTTYNSKSV